MRYFSRAILPGVLGFAVAVLVAACGGSSGLFSSGQATTLDGQLSTISADIQSGRCSAAAAAAQDFNNNVSNLDGVDSRLTKNLQQASQLIAQRAQSDCQAGQTTSTPTTTKPKPKTTSTPTTATTKTTGSTGTTTTPTTGTTKTPATVPGTSTKTTPSGGAGLTNTSTDSSKTTTNGGGGGVGLGNGNGDGTGNGNGNGNGNSQ